MDNGNRSESPMQTHNPVKAVLLFTVVCLALAFAVTWLCATLMGLRDALRPFGYSLIPIAVCGSLAAVLVAPMCRAGVIETTWRRALVFNVLGLSFVIAFYMWLLTHFTGI
jgi:hypothetical protein